MTAGIARRNAARIIPPTNWAMTQEYSLSAMRAFLAVARHLSFTAAARELEITQSAVSQRVQRLERQLGIGLFRRGGRGLELSSAGRRLAETGETAFSQIARVVDGITGEEAAGPVALGVLTSFANKWLIPRLGRFYADHPQIDLVVRSENRAVDLERESIDLALIFGLRPPPAKRLHSRLLMREKLFVVCAPEYLRRAPPLKTAADLGRHRLLHDHAEWGGERNIDWGFLLDRLAVRDIDSMRGPSFSQSDLVVEAAAAGYGVALARYSIAAADLRAGRLVNPLGVEWPSDAAYYLCSLVGEWSRPTVRRLRRWLAAEAKKFAPPELLPSPDASQ